MTVHTTEAAPTRTLGLPEELILLLLNEESGYFHQVPGWNLNCAVAGAALAELSLQGRIDTDMEQLILLDATPTGNGVVDLALARIANGPEGRDARYWVEELASRAEMMIDLTLDLLIRIGMLQHHDGDYWSLTPAALHIDVFAGDGDSDTTLQFVKARISKSIFMDAIPSPRDVIIVALANACDVLRHIFALDETSDERIELICQMDLIGRAIAEAVADNLLRSLAPSPSLKKTIPTVPLRRVALNHHIRRGNIPAAFAQLAEEYGPVFQIKSPFSNEPMIFLAGARVNHWVRRYSRMFVSSGTYLQGLERAYHASGLLPALDGTDHFQIRKMLKPSYAGTRVGESLESVLCNSRDHLAGLSVGTTRSLVDLCRRLSNAVLPPLLVGVETDDVFDDLVAYKIRALKTQVVNVLPRILLKTPRMKKKAKSIDILRDRILSSHTAALRAGCPRDHADDVLSIHRTDPILVPEANLRFQFSAPVLAAVYAGDELSFVLYSMLTQPELYASIRAEADAIFDSGNPTADDFTSLNTDITSRFIMECLRLYPTVAMSMRTVVNTCVVEDYELSVGSRLYLAQTSTHYMSDVFPDPFTFDIDRYLPGRAEHRTPGYAPYGLGTHSCLGAQFVEFLMTIELLLLAHHFEIEIDSSKHKLKIDPFPSMSPNKRHKVRIVEQRRELTVRGTETRN